VTGDWVKSLFVEFYYQLMSYAIPILA